MQNIVTCSISVNITFIISTSRRRALVERERLIENSARVLDGDCVSWRKLVQLKGQSS